jgi:hypothetical protein
VLLQLAEDGLAPNNAPADEAADAAERLEEALERIAALAARRGDPISEPAGPGDHKAGSPEVAQRLDALIADLRAALGPNS